jgi:GDPmannose 4,6-dehydratase
MKRKALITGISGQDGSYLAEFLLEKDYEVFGIVRRKSMVEENSTRIDHLKSGGYVNTEYGDLTDKTSLERIIKLIRPDEVYNLAAQSHVGISFKIPEYTLEVNANGFLKLLETIREYVPDCKVYQASSSEMFGNEIDIDGYQRETTQMKPVSPYGCSKVCAHNLAEHYKIAYNMFIVSGILFNHESPRRGGNFVTQKIVQAAWNIKKGKSSQLKLGNINSSRDWGHAKDFVRAMWMMMQLAVPKNYVVASQESHTIGGFCNVVFDKLDLNYTNYVVIDEQFIRPHELNYLRGDSQLIRKLLGWEPEYSFTELVDEMIEAAK